MKKISADRTFSIKNATLGALLLCIASGIGISSCSKYEEEPPRYEKNTDYLIPSSETPTDEERARVSEIVNEYLELFM